MQAYNMAALWQLPMLFVVENNHFGMGMLPSRHPPPLLPLTYHPVSAPYTPTLTFGTVLHYRVGTCCA